VVLVLWWEIMNVLSLMLDVGKFFIIKFRGCRNFSYAERFGICERHLF